MSIKKMEDSYSKNISLRLSNINHIKHYQGRAKTSFSNAVNLIIAEWVRFRNIQDKLDQEEQKLVQEKYYPKDFNKEVGKDDINSVRQV